MADFITQLSLQRITTIPCDSHTSCLLSLHTQTSQCTVASVILVGRSLVPISAHTRLLGLIIIFSQIQHNMYLNPLYKWPTTWLPSFPATTSTSNYSQCSRTLMRLPSVLPCLSNQTYHWAVDKNQLSQALLSTLPRTDYPSHLYR